MVMFLWFFLLKSRSGQKEGVFPGLFEAFLPTFAQERDGDLDEGLAREVHHAWCPLDAGRLASRVLGGFSGVIWVWVKTPYPSDP